jgi:oligopeptide/dipeptide ABC transporter ATP-binding protein
LDDKETVLDVQDLQTHFRTKFGTVKAVDGVTFSLKRGETMGIVGESGSGKSVTVLSLMRLVPIPPGEIVGGKIFLDGEDILELSELDMVKVRGSKIAMILQDPMTSLNPVFQVGSQVGEAIHIHQKLQGNTLLDRIINVLRQVKIPAAESRIKDYPHQLSGGMRQRVVGAISISCEPKVLIADEPTTSLDATVQAQYLKLLKDIQEESDLAIVFITHDLGIVAKMCDKVAVMYAGKIVEQGSVREIYNSPKHPYTQALIQSIPRLGNKDPLYVIPGQPPNLADLPTGCAFHPRCPFATEKCINEDPPYVSFLNGQESKCWLSVEEAKNG